MNLLLDNIIEKLDSIIEYEIKNIKSSTENMDNHISFIEKIYNSIRLPFNFYTYIKLPLNLQESSKQQIQN